MFTNLPTAAPSRECPEMRQILDEIEKTTVPYFLRKFALATCKTGSRIVCNPPVMDTDFDIVVLLKHTDDCKYLEDEGYTYTIPTQDDGYELQEIETEGTNEHWLRTYRKGEVNLICVLDPVRFGRWKLGTDIARTLNLKSREDRVALFALVKAHREYEAINLPLCFA